MYLDKLEKTCNYCSDNLRDLEALVKTSGKFKQRKMREILLTMCETYQASLQAIKSQNLRSVLLLKITSFNSCSHQLQGQGQGQGDMSPSEDQLKPRDLMDLNEQASLLFTSDFDTNSVTNRLDYHLRVKPSPAIPVVEQIVKVKPSRAARLIIYVEIVLLLLCIAYLGHRYLTQ